MQALSSGNSVGKPFKVFTFKTSQHSAEMSYVVKETQRFNVNKYDVIFGKNVSYYVEDIIAQGVYGRVFKCRQLGNGEKRAIKVVRQDYYTLGKRECEILNEISTLDPDKNNLLKVIHNFKYKNNICIVSDLMDETLAQFSIRRNFKPLRMSELRLITQQMLVALDTLKGIGVVHADLKPDNIMFADRKSKDLKVKLIDFGLAMRVNQIRRGICVQNLTYRAPEVILGLPIDESIDMWALGCILFLLFSGSRLYPTDTEYSVIKT